MLQTKAWQFDKDHVLHPYTDFSSFATTGSQVISQASGNYVIDDQGQKYLDAIAGLWCVNIGHGRQEMAKAISDQTLKMQYYNPFGHSTNEPAAHLSHWLAEHAPGDLNHVYYSCGGSTANEIAIRIVHYYNNMRGLWKKKKIISRNNAYHGGIGIAAQLTGIHGTKFGFDQLGENIVHHISAASLYDKPDHFSDSQYCDFLVDEFEQRIRQLGPDNVAAFIAEPIMGAGGVLVQPEGYFRRMKAVCEHYDLLFIADEVVTAFGRLGAWFASQSLFGVEPDLLVCAKGLTSGYIPLGGTLISDKVYEVISKPQCEGGQFSMGLTYFGHPVACAAALKNIEIMAREKLLANAKIVGAYLQKTAQNLLNLPYVGDIRGQGLMLGIELVADKHTKSGFAHPLSPADIIFQKCQKRGVIVRPVGNKIILSPPLTVQNDEIDQIISAISESISEFAAKQG